MVRCPKCQTQLTLDMKHLDEDTALVCRGCRSILKTKIVIEILVEQNGSSAAPRPSPRAESTVVEEISKPSPSIPPKPQESLRENTPTAAGLDPKKILIAIDGEGTKELIKELLTEAGFNVLEAAAGGEIIPILNKHRPAVALIDVGLPDGLGSDFCGLIKKDPRLKETIVILMASIYEKNNKYRRQPSSLFGADDYIERHHIQKDLLVRIRKQLNLKNLDETSGNPPPPAEPITAPSPRETSQPFLEETVKPQHPAKEPVPSSVSDEEEISFDLKPRSNPILEQSAPSLTVPMAEKVTESKEHEEARRLARIIVSDIVLYNKKKVDEGIRSNTFYELLKEEIEEGRKHYESRIPPEVQKVRDFFKEAFEDYIKKKKGQSA